MQILERHHSHIEKWFFFAILTAYLDANVESCLNHVMFTLHLLCKKWRVSGHVALIYLTKYVFAEWEMFSNIAYTPSIPWRRQPQPKWILFNFLISQFLACIRLILIKLLWHFSMCWWIQSLDYAAIVVGQEGIYRRQWWCK